MINGSISACDHQCEPGNAEPEIGTDGSSQTRQNPRIDGYGVGFGPPTVSRCGFSTGLEPNSPVVVVQTRTAGGLPGPVANTTSDEHDLTKWFPLARLLSGVPDIAYVLWGKPFQPYTQGPPLKQESYESFVRVTDGIPSPTHHLLWPSQTLTFSVLEKSPSSCEVSRSGFWMGLEPN